MRRLLRRDGGQSVVEFALVLPLLVALLLFLVEFALGMNQEIDATQVASQAARLAAVNSSWISSSGGMANLVHQQADMKNLQNATVAVCFPDGTAAAGHPVRITVTSQFNVTGFFLPTISIPIRGSATMNLEQAPPYNFAATGTCPT